MKRFFDIIKSGCLIFTLITLFFYSVGGIISGSEQEFIPSLKYIWLFFLFSVLLAFANEILKAEKPGAAAKLGIHFLCSAAIYFVTVVLCGGFIKNGAQTVVAISLFIIAYAVFAIIYAIRRGRKKPEEKYEKMFK